MLIYLEADDIRLVTCSLGPHFLSCRLGLRRKAVILPASLKAATQVPQNAANDFSYSFFFFLWGGVLENGLTTGGSGSSIWGWHLYKKNYIGTHVKTGEAGGGGSNRFFSNWKK